MIWKSEIEDAMALIEPYVVQTPTLIHHNMDLPYPIDLKLEQLQHSGSFKARGAFNTLLRRNVPDAGVVAASGGNHGAAVAYAAARLGYRARVYVPEIAGPAKIGLIRDQGADLVVVPGAYANALDMAQDYEARTGAMQIHAYDAPETVQGQGTMMMEWEAQGLAADTVLIAVGGGGLIGGSLAWLNGRRKVVAVEPENAPTLNAALAHGPDSEVEVSGIAANSLGARKIGQICYGLVQEFNVQSLLVSDDAIAAAQRLLWRRARLLVEPAGATALAALLSGVYTPEPGERVAVVVCGGNIAPDPFA